MKALPLAILVASLLVAPLALTAAPSLMLRGPVPDAGIDTPPFQNRQPCNYGRAPGSAIFADDFEAGPGGWTKFSAVTRPNLWHWSTFAGNNSAMDGLFHGGPGRMYYGIENAFGGTFNTDPVENRGEIRSVPITIPAGPGAVVVNLNTKWHVEWDRPTIYDAMEFGYVNAAGQRTLVCYFGPWMGHAAEPGIGYYVNSPTGATVITGCKQYRNHDPLCQDQDVGDLLVFDLAPQVNLWEARNILLPAALAGQTIQLLFYFQEGDALINDGSGWMVDDVEVVKVV